MSKLSRLEVVSTGARRRWTLAEKQRIVAESYSSPRLVSATARRNGLSVSQLFTWRRLGREGRLVEADQTATFVQAMIGCGAPASGFASLPEHLEAAKNSPCSRYSVAPGRIEIVLRCGRRVVIDNDFDSAALARVLVLLDRP